MGAPSEGQAAAHTATPQPARRFKVSGPVLHSFAGFLSGVVATVATYPLDFVKVRYIAQDGRSSRAVDGVTRFQGVCDAIRTSYRAAGLRPMYEGVGAAVCASSASWGLYFGSYRYLQSAYRARSEGERAVSSSAAQPRSAGRVGDMLCATAAGVAATFVSSPLWLVKTRMQLQRGAGEGVFVYRNTVHGLRHIVRTEGVRGLYSGLAPSLMMVSHGSVQMTLYEWLKEAISRARVHYAAPPVGTDGLSTSEITAATIGSKCIASVVTTPLVVLRIRLQDPRNTPSADQAYTGVVRSLQQIVQREGVRGLYRGLVPTLVRTVPSALVTFLTYEHISKGLFDCFGE